MRVCVCVCACVYDLRHKATKPEIYKRPRLQHTNNESLARVGRRGGQPWLLKLQLYPLVQQSLQQWSPMDVADVEAAAYHHVIRSQSPAVSACNVGQSAVTRNYYYLLTAFNPVNRTGSPQGFSLIQILHINTHTN